VAAAAPGRVRVAKHGNRSRTGRGSAEVLQALGVNVDAPPVTQARCLAEAGVCFCFAVHHHPAARHAASARRALGFPTLFNLLGPLTNPAGADRQLIGVYEPRAVQLVAGALAQLGTARAMVVHGLDGIDEITTTAATLVADVQHGTVTSREFNAASLHIQTSTLQQLQAATLDDSVRIALEVLDNSPGPALDIVLVNSAAALVVAGAADSLPVALQMSTAAMASGAARRTLAQLVTTSNQ
jgi:anthranilate phosphoribosyltransferase